MRKALVSDEATSSKNPDRYSKIFLSGVRMKQLQITPPLLEQSKVHQLLVIRYRAKLWHTEVGIQLENNSKKQTRSPAGTFQINTRESLETLEISLSIVSLMVVLSWVLPLVLNQTKSRVEGPNQKDPTVFNQRKRQCRRGPTLFIGPTRRRVGGKQHKSGSYLVITVACPISQRHQWRRARMGSGILLRGPQQAGLAPVKLLGKHITCRCI